MVNGKNQVVRELFKKMANAPKALNIRAKTKPALPEIDSGKAGYQLYIMVEVSEP